jgi:hypothetical protein
MQKLFFRLAGKLILTISFTVVCSFYVKAQSLYLPQSYQFYQKFNADVYSKGSNMHTTLRPFLIDSTLAGKYNQLMHLGYDSSRRSWLGRKLFQEHLFEINEKEYTFYADFLTENLFGKDFKDKVTPSNFKPVGVGVKTQLGLNTRGFQIGGTVGDKFSFYTSGYENQGAFANYYNDYVNSTGIVPGQAYDRSFGKPHKDWSYVTAILSYTPIKQLNITLGQDKTFIGDGYRSVLLSDYSANYPLLRLTANLGNVQYMAMWTYLQDIRSPKFDTFGSNRRKWGLFHYIDWNVNNSLSLGFFNAYIAPEADDQGNRRGFDVNFINPVFFAGSLGPSSQPGNSLVGFTGKYKFLDKNALYGQALIDKVSSANGSTTTSSFQAGVRGADVFAVKNLNYLVEYNTSKPYTYSNQNSISSYSFYGEPLAHPFGANFKEFLGIVNYSAGKFDFQTEFIFSKYGLDATAAQNNGKDINKPFTQAVNSSTGQGLNTKLYYAEGTVSYIVNPKYNLRLELGGLYRQEKNALGTKNTAMLSFGLRSSFRNLYHDF